MHQKYADTATILSFIAPLNMETNFLFWACYHQAIFTYTHMFIYAWTKNSNNYDLPAAFMSSFFPYISLHFS